MVGNDGMGGSKPLNSCCSHNYSVGEAVVDIRGVFEKVVLGDFAAYWGSVE